MKDNLEKVNSLFIEYKFTKLNNLDLNNLKIIDDIMNFMKLFDFEYYEILEKDFYSFDTKQFWWNEKYSNSTYYRIKNKAIELFIELHNNYVDQYS